jgi:hypothetical protein
VINNMRALQTLIFFLAAASGCTSSVPAVSNNEVPVENSTSALNTMVDQAKADAAERTGKSAKEITVVSAERVTWSDGSMGCPMPGRMYPQMLTSGYRIVLRVGEQEMDYHAGNAGKPVLCPADRAKAPLPSRDT